MARIVQDWTNWPNNPLITEFMKMALMRRDAWVDEECNVWIQEVRKDARTGEKQRLTYMLDTHTDPH